MKTLCSNGLIVYLKYTHTLRTKHTSTLAQMRAKHTRRMNTADSQMCAHKKQTEYHLNERPNVCVLFCIPLFHFFLFEFLCRQKGIVHTYVCTYLPSMYVCILYMGRHTATHMYAPKNKTRECKKQKRARHKHITRLHTHTQIGSSHAVSSLVWVV